MMPLLGQLCAQRGAGVLFGPLSNTFQAVLGTQASIGRLYQDQQPQCHCHVDDLSSRASSGPGWQGSGLQRLAFSTQVEPASSSSQGSAQAQQQASQESIEQIRARIFGEPIKPDERTGRRVLARPLQGAQLAAWYFMPPRVPGTHNEEREYVLRRKLNKRQKKAADDEGTAKGGKKK